jgi:hypothetical protein
MRQPDELTAAAFHESGHAVVTVRSFRDAHWLPKPPPLLPVRYVDVRDGGGGACVGANIYSSTSCIKERYRPLMEWQVMIYLAGGVADGLHRGEAATSKDMDNDLPKAWDLLDGGLRRLTGPSSRGQRRCSLSIGEPSRHWHPS